MISVADYAGYLRGQARAAADEIERAAVDWAALAAWAAESVLDVHYIERLYGGVESMLLYVTVGGPTVWADTAAGCVTARAPGAEAREPLSERAAAMLQSMAEEIINKQ